MALRKLRRLGTEKVLAAPKGFVVKPRPRRVRLKRSPVDEDVSFDQAVFEIVEQIIIEAEALPDQDYKEEWLDAVQTFARGGGDLSMLLAATEFRRRVVPIDEFMFSNTYLGMEEDEIFPAVIEACHDLDSGNYNQAVLKGALGTGKTTLANIFLGRSVYELSCMRHPQTTFGIQAKSSIVFTIQSVRFNTAKKAVFEEFGQYINNSPYFTHIYPYDRKVVSSMIFREQRVTIMPVTSSTTGVISMNVIGGILDELNFMQKIQKSKSADAETDGTFNQAKLLYNNLARRRKTRFTRQGKVPGILFLVSSSRYPDDFTEEKAKEALSQGGTDPGIFVYQHSQWSAKNPSTFLPEKFRVQVGNERSKSKLLAPEEAAARNTEVIEVPMDFHPEFTKDIDGSLRDFAGVTILAVSPFISRRDTIRDAMTLGALHGYQNPFNVEEVDLSLGIPIPNKDLLRLDVNNFRTAHVDLGLTKDACGIAIGHVAGIKVVDRMNPETEEMEIEVLPVIAIDLVLRIVAPPNGEIEFAKIRELLSSLRDHYSLNIKYVTFDGFQSVDSRQILRRQGFQTDYLSVEKIEPYRALRDCLYDGRLLLPNHQFLLRELAELEMVRHNNKDKVDHRPQGTKDVADAVCGVTAFLLKRRAAWAGLHVGTASGMHLLGTYVPGQEADPKLEEAMVVSSRHRTVRKKSTRKTPKRR